MIRPMLSRYDDPDAVDHAFEAAEADRLLALAAVERADDRSPWSVFGHAHRLLAAASGTERAPS